VGGGIIGELVPLIGCAAPRLPAHYAMSTLRTRFFVTQFLRGRVSRYASCARHLMLALGGTTGALTAQNSMPPMPASGVIPHNTAREQALLSGVTVADGFTATLFAAPPVAMYPVCLTATVEGAVFVCVDPNLSLTATKGRGRVMRLVDDNRDGVADRYTTFATMDSPRGVAYDGRTLYVMHPPNLTAYRDTTGDGIADVSEDIVTGLGFDLDFRGADHTTNGITLGIDGWLYIAVGDYGYRKATGKDGTTIAHRGGGVVRVRADGSGLELFARGTRNIYDVAVDPFVNVFTRDNTNDGDGWDIRLHFLPPGANMGYPTLYKHFASEHMTSLADYGGGSGTGGLWVHDNEFPEGFGNTLYTADWLLNEVFRHPLTRKGGSYDVKQERFVSVPHPADMAMDGQSNMFVASLAGGEYTYEGDSVGFVVRVSPVRSSVSAPPNIPTLSDVALRTLLASGNAEYRLHAQHEMLRRGERPGVVSGLTSLSGNALRPAYARVAAIYTLRQLVGARSHAALRTAAMSGDPLVRASALRALTDDTKQLAALDPALFVAALADSNVRVQIAAVTALVRLNAGSAAANILPLTAHADATLAHLAINALVSLNASGAALTALNGTDPAVRAGALRALQGMYEPSVVSALLQAASADVSATPRRYDATVALARLYHRDAEWTGDWWGTRPSFIGPYFAPAVWTESARIAPALRQALMVADGAEMPMLVESLVRNRVLPQGAKSLLIASLASPALRTEIVNAVAGSSTISKQMVPLLSTWTRSGATMQPAVAQLLAGEASIVEGALPLVQSLALSASIPEETRAQLVNKVAALPGRPGLDAATELLAQLTPPVTPAGTDALPLEAAWRRYVGDRRRLAELDFFIELSRAATPTTRVLGFAVLLQSVRGGRAAAAVSDKVQPVLAAAWASHAAAADVARATSIMRLESAYAMQLAGLSARTAMAPVQTLDWVPLFNGKNLKDWDIKFAGYPLGTNFRNTFRVDSGMLRVKYDQWTDFTNQFGHIFHKKPFSYYIVAAEYRFTGQQVTGAGAGNSWAIRNNGIMVHSQSAASMGLMQDFPISLEVQLLGGLGYGTRTNGNLCTPGTHVVMNDKLVTTHCTNSSSVTFVGDQWIRMEAMVLGDSVIKHIVNGDTVMTYFKPQMGGGAANNTNPGVLVNGKMLSEGYISLQAETAPIDFRKVEIVNLKGCMNPADANFRRYFVKSDPAACKSR